LRIGFKKEYNTYWTEEDMRIQNYDDIANLLKEVTGSNYDDISNSCLRTSSRVFEHLWNGLGLLPEFITCVDGVGILATYRGVRVEVYNAGDSCVVIKHNDEIESVDVSIGRDDLLCQLVMKIFKI
jgi:hypothetical protein